MHTCPVCLREFESYWVYVNHGCFGPTTASPDSYQTYSGDHTTPLGQPYTAAPVYKLVYVNDATEEQGTLSTGTDYAALENYAALLRLVRPTSEHFEVVFEADDRNLHPLADLSDFLGQAAP